MKLITHLLQVIRLRMRGAVPLCLVLSKLRAGTSLSYIDASSSNVKLGDYIEQGEKECHVLGYSLVEVYLCSGLKGKPFTSPSCLLLSWLILEP
jgi:predicted metalloprotease